MGSEIKPHASGSLTSPDRLRKIDQLREKNIDVILPLPTLVAVGDQSSGKSSLLESVTGIPFPRGQELCTRYATQITHRRDPEVQIIISIIPAPQSTEEEKAKLRSYRKELSSTGELRDNFAKILDEVNVYMKIRTDKNPEGEKTFSRDTLKIEKCGPTEDYLTVIDVPGIFRLTSKGQTTESDRNLVRDMVTGFIKDKRTIILAVLPANVDVMTQEILALAEEHDPDGERTLGVLTKPDLVIERSAKEAVCNLVSGKKKPLNLGYYLVKNRGGDDDDSEDSSGLRRKERDLFQQSPWCNLPQERVGVAALRERLQDLLGEITDRAYPELRSEARKKLVEAQDQRDALGPPRQTDREQQQYIAQIAAKFQGIVRAALATDYSAHPVFDDHEMRLITYLVNFTHSFDTTMRNIGHTHSFQKGGETTEDALGSKSADKGNEALDDDDWLRDFLGENPELDGIVNLVKLQDSSFSVAKGNGEWIEALYHGSRGIELGTFSPTVLASAFRDQSVKWDLISERYMSRVILTIHYFIKEVLAVACTDSKTRQRLEEIIIDDLVARYKTGMDSAKFLVQVERQQRPYTVNQYFNSNLQAARGQRMYDALAPKSSDAGRGYIDSNKVVHLEDVKTAMTNKSNEQHAQEDIHDILKSYYKVALKRFVDNIWFHAVDHHLLSGPNSPLTHFSEQWVLGLDEDSLNAIAGESRSTRDKRLELSKKIADLEEALRILK